jgi:hypothetical protein
MQKPLSKQPFPPPPRTDDWRELSRWFYEIYRRLNDPTLIGAETSGTSATDLTAHVAASNPHPVYSTDADLAGEASTRSAADSAESAARVAADLAEAGARSAADVAEAIARSGADSAHAALTVAHGATGAVMGTTNTQGVSNKTLDATNKFGGATDHTMFEADGTMVAVGAATTYDDSQAAVIYMRSGGTARRTTTSASRSSGCGRG